MDSKIKKEKLPSNDTSMIDAVFEIESKEKILEKETQKEARSDYLDKSKKNIFLKLQIKIE